MVECAVNIHPVLQETEAGEWSGVVCSEVDEGGGPRVRHFFLYKNAR